MPRPLPGSLIHPEDRNNPTCENFAKNQPVEKRFVISPRLFDQRALDRAGRAICRIVYAHGVKIDTIARISSVSEEMVRRALQNKGQFNQPPDAVGNDYSYVDAEYADKYPPINGLGGHQTRSGRHLIEDTEEEKKPIISTERKPIVPMETNGKGRRAPSIIDLSGDTPPPSQSKLIPPAEAHKSGPGTNRRKPAQSKDKSRREQSIINLTEDTPEPPELKSCSPVGIRKSAAGNTGGLISLQRHKSRRRNKGEEQLRPKSSESGDASEPPNTHTSRASTVPEPSSLLPVIKPKSERNSPILESSGRDTDTSGETLNIMNSTKSTHNSGIPIRGFLRNVGGFDLSSWQHDFEAKGLSSMETLAIISAWEERKLAKTLVKLFPKMTEIQRYALVESLVEMNERNSSLLH